MKQKPTIRVTITLETEKEKEKIVNEAKKDGRTIAQYLRRKALGLS